MDGFFILQDAEKNVACILNVGEIAAVSETKIGDDEMCLVTLNSGRTVQLVKGASNTVWAKIGECYSAAKTKTDNAPSDGSDPVAELRQLVAAGH